MAKNRKAKSAESLAFIPANVIYENAVFGYAEVQRDDGDDLDIDIHLWPVDADHCLSPEPWNCPCLPRIQTVFASGVRVIVHRKTQ